MAENGIVSQANTNRIFIRYTQIIRYTNCGGGKGQLGLDINSLRMIHFTLCNNLWLSTDSEKPKNIWDILNMYLIQNNKTDHCYYQCNH